MVGRISDQSYINKRMVTMLCFRGRKGANMSTALVSEWTARVTDPRLTLIELERSGVLLHNAERLSVTDQAGARSKSWLSALFHQPTPAVR
jgi:hypothetical protein